MSAPALIQIITVFKDEDSLVPSKEKTSNSSLPYNSKCPILFNIMANVRSIGLQRVKDVLHSV